MKYKIVGRDKRYGIKECYGIFDNLKDCLNHLNTLKTGSLGNIIKFSYKEVKQNE